MNAALAAVTGMPAGAVRAAAEQWRGLSLAHVDGSGGRELWSVYGLLRSWLLAPERLSAEAVRAAHSAEVIQVTHTWAQSPRFEVTEATIPQLQATMATGLVTSRDLTAMYLARIEAYDQRGPALNATPYPAGYMLAVLPLVVLTDRVPARSVFLASSALGALSCFGIALSNTFLAALAWRAVSGAAIAGIYMPGLRALTDGMAGARRARVAAW